MKRKYTALILCAALICILFSACFGENTATVKNASFSLKAETETASAELNGDYAKIDLINPGLDAADITVVIYSLTEKKETARVDLGNGVFSTGNLKDGFFAVDEVNKNVRFFDFSGAETYNAEIKTDAEFFATSYVSDDGKYLMYALPEDSEICLYELSSGKTYVTGKFTERAESAGYSGGVFYIWAGSGGILSVSTRKKQLITEFDSTDISLATKSGGVGYGTGRELLYIDGSRADKTEKIYRRNINETAVNVIPFGVVTCLSANNADILRIYSARTDAFREIRPSGSFINCSDGGSGRICVTEKSEDGFTFGIYTVKDIEKQQVKGKTNIETGENESPADFATDENDSSAENSESHIIKNVPVFSQMPEYPTGCETVSTVMALRYAGYNITAAEFIDKYLPQSSGFKEKEGVRYGPDPEKTFVGSPRSAGGYGCFAPVIEKALSDCLGNNAAVIKPAGKELEELCKSYVSCDTPVIIWTTISLLDTYPAEKWRLDDGSDFYWPANEHCMLLIGYDGSGYYFNDPYVGKTVKYPKALAETRYNELGKQAVLITNKNN